MSNKPPDFRGLPLLGIYFLIAMWYNTKGETDRSKGVPTMKRLKNLWNKLTRGPKIFEAVLCIIGIAATFAIIYIISNAFWPILLAGPLLYTAYKRYSRKKDKHT